jgi:hypothetical protein
VPNQRTNPPPPSISIALPDLHLGSDAGGDSAAVIYTLIGTAKLGGINPQHYLRYVRSNSTGGPPGLAAAVTASRNPSAS